MICPPKVRLFGGLFLANTCYENSRRKKGSKPKGESLKVYSLFALTFNPVLAYGFQLVA